MVLYGQTLSRVILDKSYIMKKVLVITYYWPPSGGPGVQRWLKFVKYLPQFGYEPIVLTVDPKKATYPLVDDTLSKEIDGKLQVIYTNTSEPYSLYKKLFRRKQVPYSGFANDPGTGFLNKLARFIRGNIFVPDARIGWNRYALPKALKLIDSHKIATIITTSPPHSTQLIGRKIKKRRPQVQWIADLRDPWTDIYYYDKMLHLPFIKKSDARLERKVLMQADKLVTVSYFLAEGFSYKLKASQQRHIDVITNGYDPDDFAQQHPEPAGDKFIITYTGTVSDEYDLSGLIKALSRAKANMPIPLELNFIGHVCDYWKKRLQDSFPDSLQLMEHVSHKQAITHMYSAHMLLLLIPDIPGNMGIVTGKIFEYIATRRPVLGVGPHLGDASIILDEINAGRMFEYDDIKEMVNFIEKQCSQKTQESRYDPEAYSRVNLTKKLTRLISG